MRKERLMLYLPLSCLVVLVIILYSPEIFSTYIPVLSEVRFEQKTDLTLTFSIAIFAAMEGYATFQRWGMEHKRHRIEDARRELEKAYGPLYTLLNKSVPTNERKTEVWWDFEERKRINEILATYPFMFPPRINDLWQQKIRNPEALIQTSDPNSVDINMSAYYELRNMINEEYTSRLKGYRGLLEK
ncbi:MAG: hypothetical protein ACE14S_03640 [Candidatus Bathyarchaeia archaeon]